MVDGNNEIIVGHGRYFAAMELKLKEAPVVRIENLTPKQVEAYRIADNRLNESDWDMSLVIEQLKFLDAKGVDITITGFTKDIFGVSEDNFDAESEYAKITSPRVNLGEIWALDEHRLMCGDASDITAHKKLMGGVSARMVFTDPPYGVAYSSGAARGDKSKHDLIKNDELVGAKLVEFLRDCFNNLDIVTLPDCCFYIWHATSTEAEFREALEKSEASDWQIHQTIIWLKSHFSLTRADYQHIYEPCYYGWKKGKKHFTNKNLRGYDNVIKLDAESFSEMLNVWYIDRDNLAHYEHPTQKPVRLAERAIKKSSDEGDVVVDCFGGSGSTLIACEQLNRKCYMMELDPKYCEVIIKRWETLTKKKAKKL